MGGGGGFRSFRKKAMKLVLAALAYWLGHLTGLLPSFGPASQLCPVDSYYDTMQRKCSLCARCTGDELEISPCSAFFDATCSTCIAGKEYFSIGSGACQPCKSCPPGMVAETCVGARDTTCSVMDGTGFHDTQDNQKDNSPSLHHVERATSLPPPATAEQQVKTPGIVPPHKHEPWQSQSPAPHDSALQKSDCDQGLQQGVFTKECVEDGWGAKCYSPQNLDVLVALPYDNRMKPALIQIMFQNLVTMECANHGFNLHLALYDKPFNNSMNAKQTKLTGRTILATIRNIVIHDYLESYHDYVLWLDADVVKYPADLVRQLYETNPDGVNAPLVVIESSDEPWYHKAVCGNELCPHATICGRPQCPRAKMFYDRAAFISTGANITGDEAFPGNALPWPPYLGHGAWRTRVTECESVGTVYMLPARAYRAGRDPSVTDRDVYRNPPQHFPTAFTEHFPVVHYCKYVLGMDVLTNMAIEAEHAYLPKYGLEWHSEPMSIWEQWLLPYRGQALHDPKLINTLKPSFYIEEEEHLKEKNILWSALAYFGDAPSGGGGGSNATDDDEHERGGAGA